MHIHILGVCGTFMGGLAQLAVALGHRVTGCDAQVYPPMSTQLQDAGIGLIEGFDAAQLALQPDLWVVGNVVSRGNPLLEAVLDAGLPYTSGPQWVGEQVLAGRHVLAVAGTHGKTTTAAMLAWILVSAGRQPGYLIGGVPRNFGRSALLGLAGAPFVIEADEYDTAFFDKRSKFVHYRPRTAILNNLEFDHADIFPDVEAIETQFHHLVRTVPGAGRLVVNADDVHLRRVLARGAWSATVFFGEGAYGGFTAQAQDEGRFLVLRAEEAVGAVTWTLSGAHNRSNALAAIAAAEHVGVAPAEACAALSTFQNVRRRLENRGEVGGVTVLDDFAHHPTAIATTIAGLRRAEPGRRILAVFEPRSNTMKLGALRARLPAALREADAVFCHTAGLSWDAAGCLAELPQPVLCTADIEALVTAVLSTALPGDQILVMSNGGFGGIHERLLKGLAARDGRAVAT
ncbi:MAG: UDP-N-acetylmuramate:L-alanyl-gamma-D-glutamyl-meso-diaminopimelate ligase [Burkholderiaceae bacterium]